MIKKWIRFSLLSLFLISIFFSVSSVFAQQGTTSTTNKVWDIAYLALAISTILGIFVVILLLYFMNKYKEGSNANRRVVSHKFERNLEVVWIFASLILVVFATGVTLAYTGDIEAIRTEENVEKTIYVQGRQFGWDFFETLPDKSANRTADLGSSLELEVNKKYELVITSGDVIHSFFVFDLGIKQDAVPGREVSVFVEPKVTGSYEIRCAQYCGSGHYTMQAAFGENQYVIVS
ncbi:MAG: hypothetical protein ACW981_11420 [Candidatus Hodarchaeales archaeon]|jgi:cytochrome c oxidase subunit 2